MSTRLRYATLWAMLVVIVTSATEYQTVWAVDLSPLRSFRSHQSVVRVYQREAGSLLRSWNGHKGPTFSLADSPTAEILATGGGQSGESGEVTLWNLRGQRLATSQRLGGPAFSVTFSPDGHLLAAGSQDSTIRLWRIDAD